MLDALRGRGLRVLLPIARTTHHGVPQPLCWASTSPGNWWPHALACGAGGPPLPPTVLAEADLVLVPAPAGTSRAPGWVAAAGSDDLFASIPADPGARLMAVVRDDEVLDILPSESHDVPMTDVLTPNRGARAAGRHGNARHQIAVLALETVEC